MCLGGVGERLAERVWTRWRHREKARQAAGQRSYLAVSSEDVFTLQLSGKIITEYAKLEVSYSRMHDDVESSLTTSEDNIEDNIEDKRPIYHCCLVSSIA